MNSASTADLYEIKQVPKASASGFWRAGHGKQYEKIFDLSRVVLHAGFVLALAISPNTVITDPWLKERRRRDAAITMSIYQEVIGRFISRTEALQIARQILEQAELERLETADFEAARGIHWGD